MMLKSTQQMELIQVPVNVERTIVSDASWRYLARGDPATSLLLG
jgi:hypothetical protein